MLSYSIILIVFIVIDYKMGWLLQLSMLVILATVKADEADDPEGLMEPLQG